MDLYAACDICGHRYVLPQDRQGRRTKCKSCGVPFEVSEVNFYDPDTSEVEVDELGEEEPEPGVVAKLLRIVGHGMTAVVTIALLVWMSSLFFRTPRTAVAALSAAQPNSQTGFGRQTRQPTPRTFGQMPGSSQTPFAPQVSPPGSTLPQQGTPPFSPPFNPADMQGRLQQQMQRQQQRIHERMQGTPIPQRPFGPPASNPNAGRP